MNLKQRIKEIIFCALNDLDIEFNLLDIMVEVPKNRENGDFSSNIAMQLTKVLKDNPRNIAEKIVDKIKENTTKYGEFVCSEYQWLPLDKQKEQANKMANMTKKEKGKKD